MTLNFPLAIIGSQWGDEGKGKIVDLLSKQADIVVRFNGGNNAGHTVIYKNEDVHLHVLPSGIFHEKKVVITQGAVFDPEILLSELEFCQKRRIKLDLIIDYRVNMVMPYHRLLDKATEAWKGKKATGSLHLGIGYCYEDRNNRSGIRCEDLLYPKILKEKIFTIFPLKKSIIEKAYGGKVDINEEQICKRYLFFAKIFKKYIKDAAVFLHDNWTKKKILFEGANGTMLDGNFGTYPYTVACNAFSSSIFPYAGLPPEKLNTYGIVKAYTTRVGGGPFATEQQNGYGEALQKVGKEFGATSGRKRRCGWLDLCVLKYAHRLNHFNNLIITKIDVLSQFKEIPVCIAYQIKGKKIYEFPSITHDYYHCKPVYKVFKGWQKDISQITKYQDLPQEAKIYLKFIEKELNIPIKIISIGPKRNQIMYTPGVS